uniref:CCHC-type domain-containing protein n=1 Tax=Biomphalaria glabrata TaxID=6526 RepID=A0A2C9KNS9_BIOGL
MVAAETERLEKERIREAERLEREKVREVKRVREKEEAEREKVREAERIEREKKEEADRKVRIQVEQMRIEAGVSVPTEGNSNNSANIESLSSAAWMKKKIQTFAEDRDDIGDYLKRFEIKLAKFNVREKEWSEILLDFVHGQALTICQNHDHLMQNSYQVLKKELLNAYGHNAATFRKKYYENTPFSQVDPQTTINSEKDFFTKWLGFENVENTYEGLKNFILIDNFINKCDPQLQSFIKERNPNVIEDLVEIIRIFKNAYPNNPLLVRDHRKVIDLVGYVKGNDSNDMDYGRRNNVSDRDTYGRRNDRSRERGNNGGDSYGSIRNRSWGNENNGRESYDRKIDIPKAGDRNLKDVTCFNCQEKGHMAYQCKKHKGNGAGNRNAQGYSGTSDRGGNSFSCSCCPHMTRKR